MGHKHSCDCFPGREMLATGVSVEVESSACGSEPSCRHEPTCPFCPFCGIMHVESKPSDQHVLG
ncbi:unnamed protein product, partial [Gulo gulo]